MRVLQVYKAALPHSMGGVERVIDGIASGLLGAGHEAEVIAIGPRRETLVQPPGYRVHTVPADFERASCPVAVAALPLLRALAERADVVHYHAPWPWADALHLLGAARGRPTVVSYQSDVVRQRVLGALYRPLMHAFCAAPTVSSPARPTTWRAVRCWRAIASAREWCRSASPTGHPGVAGAAGHGLA